MAGRKWIPALLMILGSISQSSAEAVATIIKASGAVDVRKLTSRSFSPARQGAALNSGDSLRVGPKSFCIVVYTDDKSQLKIREQSRLLLMETPNTRTIGVMVGKVLAKTSKGTLKNFRVETPTSVASVKGTEWWSVVDASGTDRFYGMSGTVEVLNAVSGETAFLEAGQMVMSTPTGQMVSAPAMADEIPADPEAAAPQVQPPPPVEEEPLDAPEEGGELESVPEAAPGSASGTGSGTVTEPEAPAATEAAPAEDAQPAGGEEGADEDAEAKEGGAQKPFGMGLGLGSVTIDGVIYNQFALRPELAFGKLGIGLDVVLYVDPAGKIRKDEWNEPQDFFDKILYVRWGQKGDPFHVRYGSLENVTLGYGGIVYGYSNMMEFPQVRRIGFNTGVAIGKFNTDFFIANFKDFSRGGGLLGARASTKVWRELEVGGNFVLDVNQYSGLMDFDEDGVPDRLDDFPNEKGFVLDSDGDGVADEIDPDADGDGYTDNSQDSTIANNDPVAILKPTPFNVKEGPTRRATAMALDIGTPLLRKGGITLDIFAEANVLNFADDRTGTGLVLPGVRMGIFKFLNLFFEYRMDSGHYAPRFFDQAYDLDRVSTVADSANPDSLVIRTKDERLFAAGTEPGSRTGYYGGASLSLFNLLTGSASYTDMKSDAGDTLRSFVATLQIPKGTIPKLSHAMAYYQRNNDPNPFDFANPSESTVMGYRVGYEISAGVSMVWDFRRLYQDLNGDGAIDTDSDEVRNITTIETQFSF